MVTASPVAFLLEEGNEGLPQGNVQKSGCVGKGGGRCLPFFFFPSAGSGWDVIWCGAFSEWWTQWALDDQRWLQNNDVARQKIVPASLHTAAPHRTQKQKGIGEERDVTLLSGCFIDNARGWYYEGFVFLLHLIPNGFESSCGCGVPWMQAVVSLRHHRCQWELLSLNTHRP